MSDRTRDWETVHARLEYHRGAMERALAPGPDRVAAVFRERAARLAGPPAPQGGGEEHAFLVVTVGDARCGFELSRVSEILAQPVCTPVPGGPSSLAGVLQVRGEIRPVWDLARLLGLPEVAEGSFVLMLRGGPREFGLRVGPVEGIRLVRRDELTPGRPDSPAAQWMTSDLVTILDPDKLIEEDLK